MRSLARHQGIHYYERVAFLPKGASKKLLTKALDRLQLDALLPRRGMGDRAGAKFLQGANLDHIRTTEFRGDWTNFHHLFGNGPTWQAWSNKP